MHCQALSSSNPDKRKKAATKILKLTDPQHESSSIKPPTTPSIKAHSAAPQLNSLPPNHMLQFDNFLNRRDTEAQRKKYGNFPSQIINQKSKTPEALAEAVPLSGVKNQNHLRVSAPLRELKKEKASPQGEDHRLSDLDNSIQNKKDKNLFSRGDAEAQRTDLEGEALCTRCKENKKTSAPLRLCTRIKNKTLLDLSRIPHSPIQLAAATDVLSSLLPEITDPDRTGPPTAADIAFTSPQVVTNDAVSQLAADLKTPVKIFEYFRNNFVYEPYFGAVKGAAKTLDEMAGNDVDLASALISVYREAGIPCRYVYGTIELTPKLAASWLGVDAAQVDTLLGENHIPYKNLGTPGVGDLLVDHVWVKAYVDYLPYRGAAEVVRRPNDELEKVGDSWVDIDPSFKKYTSSERRDMEVELGIQSENFLTNIRSQTSRGVLPDNAGMTNGSKGESSDDHVTLLPQTFILNEVIGLANPLAQFLAQNHLTTATAFRQRVIKEEVYGILPRTDFYKIHARGRSFSRFPEALTATVHLKIMNRAGQEVLSFDSTLTELLTGSLTLSYEPATAEDRTIVSAWSDAPGASVDAYDVDVIPQLSLDDTVMATGAIADTLGSAHTLSWTILPAGANPAYFTAPDASGRIEASDIINAGSLSTFVFDAGTVTDSEIITIRNQIVGADVPRRR